MKINFNPTSKAVGPVNSELQMTTIYALINDNIEVCFGNTKDDDYVVFDGNATILCEGTLQECFFYHEMFYRYRGFRPMVYSREKYKEMMNEINKKYK